MIRSLITLSSLTAALILAGCATQPATTTAPAAGAQAATAAPAMSDAQIAAKLKGNWTGKWDLPGFGGGKFELVVTEVSGTEVKGQGNWYATAKGDQKMPLGSASVQGGVLNATQPDTTFKLSLKGDNELTGSWSSQGYTGPLTAKRQ